MQLLSTNFAMQPEATSGTSQPGAPAHPPSSGGGGGFENFNFILLPLMIVLFYFLMIRPQQKRQKETDNLLKGLKRGDIVRTSGGIRGEITELGDADVTLLIADKVKINVLRSHIAGKAGTEGKDAKDAKEKV